MPKTERIVHFLDNLLDPEKLADASNNGLQVAGTEDVYRVALATDASLATYEQAVKADCELLIVHHGIIWGGIPSVTGRMYKHLRLLLEQDMNLYASHLPLDAHPKVGNNACLAEMLNLENLTPFGDYHGVSLGFAGELPIPASLEAISDIFTEKIGSTQRALPFGDSPIRTVGIVSGGGASVLPEAIERGLDCLITGEASHQTYHEASESQINLLLLGHYASETVGVQALGVVLEEVFGVETHFIDLPTGF